MVGFAFLESDEAASAITRLFDFVWPTATALWNLRWQVDGFLAAVPNASYEDVASRFVTGSGIHGADIRAMSINTRWEDQKERFAEIVLTNAFAIYESWARRLLESVQITGISDRDLYREGNNTTLGLSVFIARLNTTPSVAMQAAFLPQFMAHKKVFVAQQTAMLKCYKYFKELRNCHVHNGGLADQKLVDAFLDFQPFSSASILKTKEVIEHSPVTLEVRTAISLRGVVGFCEIILRLIATVDAQISGSMAAQNAALNRMRKGMGKHILTLSSDKKRSDQQIRKICRNGNLPPPIVAEIGKIRELLLRERLVSR